MRTDEHNEANGHFRSFAIAPKNESFNCNWKWQTFSSNLPRQLRASSTFHTSTLPPSSANVAQQRTADFWSFAAFKKHLKVIHFTSREEIISRTPWRFLHRQFRKTFWALATWYRTRGKIFRKMKYRNKVHILSCILCFVHFDICSGFRDINIKACLSELPQY